MMVMADLMTVSVLSNTNYGTVNVVEEVNFKLGGVQEAYKLG